MPNPTQKHTKSRKRKRRSVIKQKMVNLILCKKCKQTAKPHMVCKFCGTYNDKSILKIKLKRNERKKREKEKKK